MNKVSALLITFFLCLMPAKAFASDAIIGPCDGVTDLTPQINTALANLPAYGGLIEFKSGRCVIASPITYTFPAAAIYSVGFKGNGQDATLLDLQGASGISLNANSPAHCFHVSDMTIGAGIVNSTYGLSVSNAQQGGAFCQNDVTRVTFRGSDGYAATNYFATGFVETGYSNINLIGDLFFADAISTHGKGIRIQGQPAGAFKYSIVINIEDVGFYNIGTAISLGGYWQGIQIGKVNVTNAVTAISEDANAAGVQAQLAIETSQLATTSNIISLGSPIDQVMISNTLFYTPPNATAILSNNGWLGGNIVGNQFTYSGAQNAPRNTVLIGPVFNAQTTTIVGNNCQGYTTCWWLMSGSSGVNVQANGYTGVSNQVVNSGAGNSVGTATK